MPESRRIELQEMLSKLLARMDQQEPVSGGSNTPPAARLLMLALALMINAHDILETGYDGGYTTEALALSGAKVTGIDVEPEHFVKLEARNWLSPYANCKLVGMNALEFLSNVPDDSYDLIFIDDSHATEHVLAEIRQVMRILRQGGIALFHDVNANHHGIETALQELLPTWQKITLPCFTPINDLADYGLGIVRKPG